MADNPSITTSRRNIIKTISAGIATTAVAGCTGPPDADQSKSATENISNSSDTNALKYRIQELETREQNSNRNSTLLKQRNRNSNQNSKQSVRNVKNSNRNSKSVIQILRSTEAKSKN